jgi:RNA polymerase sigma factor (sigma-70 family)
MAFPETRHTLIQRLAIGGEPADWRQFLDDYWGPVCRFAQRRGRVSADDAEDIAAQTLEAIIRNRLLARWSANQSAKLRTLLCTIVRNVISNRARVSSGRERALVEHAAELDRYLSTGGSGEEAPAPQDQIDALYAAWAENLAQTAVEGLLAEYTQAGRQDHFRVLYGRICDEMTSSAIAEAMGMKVTSVESCYRQARERLGEKLREVLKSYVMRYCPVDKLDAEFAEQWSQLGTYLQAHGGLESAVRESYRSFPPEHRGRWMVKVALDGRPSGPTKN